MKTQKLFSLDILIVEKLRGEENASQLVEGLLIKHYKNIEPQSIEEKKKRLALLKAEAKHKREIEEIKNAK